MSLRKTLVKRGESGIAAHLESWHVLDCVYLGTWDNVGRINRLDVFHRAEVHLGHDGQFEAGQAGE